MTKKGRDMMGMDLEVDGTLHLKTQRLDSMSALRHLELGIEKVKLQLLKLHPDNEDTVLKISKELLEYLNVLRQNLGESQERSDTFILELAPKDRWVTLRNKKVFSDESILTIAWLETSALDLIGKEKGFKPFWNQQCVESSKKWWSPTETDFADLRLNLSNGSSLVTEENSSFSTKKNQSPTPKNSQTISSVLSTSTHAEKWEDEGIVARKIRMKPTGAQKVILNGWLSTSRFVYNKSVNTIKHDGGPYRFFSLRDLHVTRNVGDKVLVDKKTGEETFIPKHVNETIHTWELITPKEIRAGAVKESADAFKNGKEALRCGRIKKFDLKYRSRKNVKTMVIPRRSIRNTNSAKSIYIYKSVIKEPIKLTERIPHLDHDCKMLKDLDGRWYLIVPIKKNVFKNSPKGGIVALDPGVKTFQTGYSEDEVFQFDISKKYLEKNEKKVSNLQSLQSKTKSQKTKTRLKKKIRKIYTRVSNYIKDLHHKTANYLLSNYQVILIPIFKSQEMVRNTKGKWFHRNINSLKHFQFRTLLETKSKFVKDSHVIVVTEEYTSKTCGSCGNVKTELTCSDRVYNCDKCGFSCERDVNGARNVLLKHLYSR